MWSFFIKQSRFTSILIFSVIVLGVLSAFLLPKEATPEVKIPYASVVTFYPGASPQDVEEFVTQPLEDNILNLEGLVGVDSVSNEGISIIFVEFDADSDLKDRIRSLQDSVTTASSELPEEAEEPVVSEQNFSNFPILTLSLSGDLPYKELVAAVETLEVELESIPGVSRVDVSGIREEQIAIDLDLSALETFQISPFEVISAFSEVQGTFPLGSVVSNELNYSVRFESDLNYEELGDLVIRSMPESSIELSDIADISIRRASESTLSYLSLNGADSDLSLTINVYNRTGSDILEVVDAINLKIEELESTVLKDIVVYTTLDNAEDTRVQLSDLTTDGIMTIILILIALFFALGFREALMASLSIPLTFLISFIGLYFIDSSLNFLSLFSLILSFGILVDTGIVITELMHTKLDSGKDPKQIALESVEEYKWPIISGTLATVAVFAPMLLMTGIIGEFVKHIPITVSLTLIASLLVGLGFLPIIGVRLFKKKHDRKTTFVERGIRAFGLAYSRWLNTYLKRPGKQKFFLVFMFLLFIGSFYFPVSGALKVVMFPEVDYRYFFIEVELPKGSQLSETEEVIQEMEVDLQNVPEISSYVANIGSSANMSDGLGAFGVSNSNLANLTVNLKEDRTRSSLEIIDELRLAFSDIPNAEIRVEGVSEGPPSSSPIEFRIVGPNLDLLSDYSDLAVQTLENIPGIINVQSSLDESLPEFILEVDQDMTTQYDLSPQTLGQLTRVLLSGFELGQLEIDGEELPVILQADMEEKIDAVLNLPVLTSLGTVPLSTFVDLNVQPAPTSIPHTDGERIVTITAEVDQTLTASEALDVFKSEFDTSALPSGYSIQYGGEADEIAESFQSLGIAMILGLILLVAILVLQFGSFRQSLIILLTIPLALIGVFTGLTLIGLPFSFPAFVGVVALGGVVVNNAILILDRIVANRKMGMEKLQAITESARSRFQPILLTTFTAIAGTLPLALRDETWAPLGFSIIFGLAFSTVLSLIVVPSAYMLFIKDRS